MKQISTARLNGRAVDSFSEDAMRVWIGLLALLVVAPAAPLGAQVRVDNADIRFGPGNTVAIVNVSNESATTGQFTLSNGDWDRRDDGGNRFFAPGTTPNSCERGLEVFPRQLRLAPNESQAVRVTLHSDSLTARTCWSIIFVQPETPPSTAAIGVRMVTRIGIKVYYIPARSVLLAEVVDFRQDSSAAPGDTAHIVVTVRNTGTAPVALTGSIEIRRADNFTVGTIPVDQVPILPGALRTLRLALPASILPGSYVALGVLDYGGDEDLAAQAPIVVKVPR